MLLKVHTSPTHRLVVIALIALSGFGLDVLAGTTSPTAPTIPDAHQYFESLISANSVTAIYETQGKNGNLLGYESFPVLKYDGLACNSELTLKNSVKINIDWAVVEKSQISDGTLSILHGADVQFLLFHMITIEGGIIVEPTNAILRLIFGINDELSRNRLLKAFELLTTTCRSKSKYD
jgi:hypothetical protein